MGSQIYAFENQTLISLELSHSNALYSRGLLPVRTKQSVRAKFLQKGIEKRKKTHLWTYEFSWFEVDVCFGPKLLTLHLMVYFSWDCYCGWVFQMYTNRQHYHDTHIAEPSQLVFSFNEPIQSKSVVQFVFQWNAFVFSWLMQWTVKCTRMEHCRGSLKTGLECLWNV